VCAALSQTAVCYVNPIPHSKEREKVGRRGGGTATQSALAERGEAEGRAAAFYPLLLLSPRSSSGFFLSFYLSVSFWLFPSNRHLSLPNLT